MRKQIDIKGISTTSLYTEGDCISLVNLRKKNGVMKPVSPRQIINTLSQTYDYLFQHNLPQTGINLIGIRSGKLYWIGSTVSQLSDIGTTETEYTSVSGFKSMTQIGNVINVLDETGLKYLIWNDSGYKVISGNVDVKVDVMVDGVMDDTEITSRAIRIYKSTAYDGDSGFADSAKRQERANTLHGMLIKAISGCKRDGYLTGFTMAMTAIELFDGSYICHSNPVLLNQAWDNGTRYNRSVSGNTVDYLSSPAAFIGKDFFCNDNVPNNFNLIDDEYYVSKIQNDTYSIVKNNTVDDHGIKTNEIPKALCFDYIYDNGSFGYSKIVPTVIIGYDQLKFKINQQIPEKYRSLVKSISVFITNEIDIYKLTDVDKSSYKGQIMYNSTTNVDQFTQLLSDLFFGLIPDQQPAKIYNETFSPTIKTNAEILKELQTNHQFYKVHEIPFDDIVEGSTSSTAVTPGSWVTIDLKGKLGDNLVMQEELLLDNFTHHSLIPNGQMVYNSKLHVWDYKTVLFSGWPLSYFSATNGTGQFQANLTTGARRYWSEVSIKTETGVSKVIRYYDYTNATLLQFAGLSPMLSYPDSRATKIRFYLEVSIPPSASVHMLHEFKLTPSENQNFAYYIDTDMKPISVWENSTLAFNVPAENLRELVFRNSMKVSAVNNPFYFPSLTTFTIGTGFILNAGTNAIRMSEGQFGQYDLYVFTTEGIYSLDTGTTVSYNRISPSRMELPIKNILCSTPFGVVFIGKRGLFIINGQQVELITAQLEQEPSDYNVIIPDTTTVPTIAIKSWNDSFREYLKTVTEIVYDAQMNEIIIVNDSEGYNFVLNLDSKEIYQSTEKIDKTVGNVYPELFAIENKSVSATINVISNGTIWYPYKGLHNENSIYVIGDAWKFPSFGGYYNVVGSINNGIPIWTQIGSYDAELGIIVHDYTESTRVVTSTSYLVKDYSQAKTTTTISGTTAEKAAVSILTRPFGFGTPDTKKLERLILRARLIGAEDMVVMNHASNDGINFIPVQGQSFSTIGNYKDIDLGLMARNKHRKFAFAFSAKLDEKSEVGILEAEVEVEYGNDKMR